MIRKIKLNLLTYFPSFYFIVFIVNVTIQNFEILTKKEEVPNRNFFFFVRLEQLD